MKAFITITGLKFHFGSKPFEVGQKVKLVKEPDNFGRGAVSDFVIQPPGADAVAQNRVRSMPMMTTQKAGCYQEPPQAILLTLPDMRPGQWARPG